MRLKNIDLWWSSDSCRTGLLPASYPRSEAMSQICWPYYLTRSQHPNTLLIHYKQCLILVFEYSRSLLGVLVALALTKVLLNTSANGSLVGKVRTDGSLSIEWSANLLSGATDRSLGCTMISLYPVQGCKTEYLLVNALPIAPSLEKTEVDPVVFSPNGSCGNVS